MRTRKRTVDVLKFLYNMTIHNSTYVDSQLLKAVFRECYNPAKKQPLEEVGPMCAGQNLDVFDKYMPT